MCLLSGRDLQLCQPLKVARKCDNFLLICCQCITVIFFVLSNVNTRQPLSFCWFFIKQVNSSSLFGYRFGMIFLVWICLSVRFHVAGKVILLILVKFGHSLTYGELCTVLECLFKLYFSLNVFPHFSHLWLLFWSIFRYAGSWEVEHSTQ